ARAVEGLGAWPEAAEEEARDRDALQRQRRAAHQHGEARRTAVGLHPLGGALRPLQTRCGDLPRRGAVASLAAGGGDDGRGAQERSRRGGARGPANGVRGEAEGGWRPAEGGPRARGALQPERERLRRSRPAARLLDPIARREEDFVQPRLGRAGGGSPVVPPFHDGRKRHQDRLAAAARLQAEQRSPVVHEIELDVASPTIRLEIALALAVRRVPAALDDRQVGREEMIADAANDAEARIEVRGGEIVEEDAADPARLAAVAKAEVLVAPALEARMQIDAERRERVPARTVEVH